MSSVPPDNPAGPFVAPKEYDSAEKERLIETISQAPKNLRLAVGGLTQEQLDTRYKNWTIRQIAHHIGDSHLHSIIRFKWALTEEYPTIKAYAEGDWARLPDSMQGELEPSLCLLDGLHAKWVQLLQTMSDDQFQLAFHHPETDSSVSLWHALANYAWHGQHHTAQINWLRQQNGW